MTFPKTKFYSLLLILLTLSSSFSHVLLSPKPLISSKQTRQNSLLPQKFREKSVSKAQMMAKAKFIDLVLKAIPAVCGVVKSAADRVTEYARKNIEEARNTLRSAIDTAKERTKDQTSESCLFFMNMKFMTKVHQSSLEFQLHLMKLFHDAGLPSAKTSVSQKVSTSDKSVIIDKIYTSIKKINLHMNEFMKRKVDDICNFDNDRENNFDLFVHQQDEALLKRINDEKDVATEELDDYVTKSFTDLQKTYNDKYASKVEIADKVGGVVLQKGFGIDPDGLKTAAKDEVDDFLSNYVKKDLKGKEILEYSAENKEEILGAFDNLKNLIYQNNPEGTPLSVKILKFFLNLVSLAMRGCKLFKSLISDKMFGEVTEKDEKKKEELEAVKATKTELVLDLIDQTGDLITYFLTIALNKVQGKDLPSLFTLAISTFKKIGSILVTLGKIAYSFLDFPYLKDTVKPVVDSVISVVTAIYEWNKMKKEKKISDNVSSLLQIYTEVTFQRKEYEKCSSMYELHQSNKQQEDLLGNLKAIMETSNLQSTVKTEEAQKFLNTYVTDVCKDNLYLCFSTFDSNILKNNLGDTHLNNLVSLYKSGPISNVIIARNQNDGEALDNIGFVPLIRLVDSDLVLYICRYCDAEYGLIEATLIEAETFGEAKKKFLAAYTDLAPQLNANKDHKYSVSYFKDKAYLVTVYKKLVNDAQFIFDFSLIQEASYKKAETLVKNSYTLQKSDKWVEIEAIKYKLLASRLTWKENSWLSTDKNINLVSKDGSSSAILTAVSGKKDCLFSLLNENVRLLNTLTYKNADEVYLLSTTADIVSKDDCKVLKNFKLKKSITDLGNRVVFELAYRKGVSKISKSFIIVSNYWVSKSETDPADSYTIYYKPLIKKPDSFSMLNNVNELTPEQSKHTINTIFEYFSSSPLKKNVKKVLCDRVVSPKNLKLESNCYFTDDKLNNVISKSVNKNYEAFAIPESIKQIQDSYKDFTTCGPISELKTLLEGSGNLHLLNSGNYKNYQTQDFHISKIRDFFMEPKNPSEIYKKLVDSKCQFDFVLPISADPKCSKGDSIILTWIHLSGSVYLIEICDNDLKHYQEKKVTLFPINKNFFVKFSMYDNELDNYNLVQDKESISKMNGYLPIPYMTRSTIYKTNILSRNLFFYFGVIGRPSFDLGFTGAVDTIYKEKCRKTVFEAFKFPGNEAKEADVGFFVGLFTSDKEFKSAYYNSMEKTMPSNVKTLKQYRGLFGESFASNSQKISLDKISLTFREHLYKIKDECSKQIVLNIPIRFNDNHGNSFCSRHLEYITNVDAEGNSISSIVESCTGNGPPIDKVYYVELIYPIESVETDLIYETFDLKWNQDQMFNYGFFPEFFTENAIMMLPIKDLVISGSTFGVNIGFRVFIRYDTRVPSKANDICKEEIVV